MDGQRDWRGILAQCMRRVRKHVASRLEITDESEPGRGTGAGGDPLKQADLAAEKVIVDTIEEHGISFTLISEESGVRGHGGAHDQCYVTTDPIDGSANLARRIPFYASSIAVSDEPTLGSVHSALVFDLLRNVSYYAEKGKGARRNGKGIVPSKLRSLDEAVVGVDFNAFRFQELIYELRDIVRRTKHLRHLGANALELCYVADGTIDAFIDIRGRLRTTDVAAASLIIKESGGWITTPEGKALDVKLDPKQKVSLIAAANGEIHKSILESMQRKY